MIKGIGIDMVQISRTRHLLEISDSFLSQTFTAAEQEAGKRCTDQAGFFSARFAAKEAVFKAVAPLLPEKTFDLRIVETLNHEDGSPYIKVSQSLEQILIKAGVDTVHISITDEGDYAVAFVIAETK